MYRRRRVGRGATSFPSDALSALCVFAWCAGYSASDGSRSEARTTVHRQLVELGGYVPPCIL